MMRIQLYRSLARTTQRQRRIVESLGLRRIGHVREINPVPSMMGMVAKVSHLVKILD